MKQRLLFLLFPCLALVLLLSCNKEKLFWSEKQIKQDLQGSWSLVPIPRYDIDFNGDSTVHVETWTFDESNCTIVNGSQTGVSTYSVHSSISKAEFKLDGVTPEFTPPARVRSINGNWRIVELEDGVLVIANDQDGTTGLTELEFLKK